MVANYTYIKTLQESNFNKRKSTLKLKVVSLKYGIKKCNFHKTMCNLFSFLGLNGLMLQVLRHLWISLQILKTIQSIMSDFPILIFVL